MIEVALSIAIIAFALVAIFGVLPAGLEVQKKNREDTIIDQDGNYLLQTIRAGAAGDATLTNHVEWIEISRGNQTTRYSASQGSLDWNSRTIIGLMSTPKRFRNEGQTNGVTAQVRAISGMASTRTLRGEETAFRYRLSSEIVPFTTYITRNLGLRSAMGEEPGGRDEVRRLLQLSDNIYEVRLTFQWPILPGGEVGSERQTFSTLVSGTLTNLNESLYFLQPSTFVERE